MDIEPAQPFTIWRKLEDPNDAATYYVKADIRDMRSNDLIDTVNLTDQSGRIFSKQIDAPSDSSGQGRWIAISTRVYTDSGYTTLSAIHREESREYKVIAKRIFMGGGGGSDVDYKKIEKLIAAALSKLPEPQKISFASLEELIQDVGNKVDEKEIPQTDLSPVLASNRALQSAVLDAIRSIPRPERVNLDPIMSKLDEFSSRTNIPDLQLFIKQLREHIIDFSDNLEKNITSKLAEAETNIKEAMTMNIENPTLSISIKPGASNKEPQEDKLKVHVDRASRLLS